MSTIRLLAAFSALLLMMVLAGGLPALSMAAEPDVIGWEGDSYFEYFRPKIVPRALSKAEHAEIKALLTRHLMPTRRAKPTAKTFAALDNGALEIISGDYATLRRLFTLAESGDKTALLAARKALLWSWGAGAPLDSTLRQHVRGALLGHYTAQIWQRYGLETGPGARLGLQFCLQGIPVLYHGAPESYWARTPLVDCGFNLMYPVKTRTREELRGFENSFDLALVVTEWLKVGKKMPMKIDRFRQMLGSPDIERARFDELIARPGSQFFNKALRWTPGEYAWLQDYATRFDRMDEVRKQDRLFANKNPEKQKRYQSERDQQIARVREEEALRTVFRDEVLRAQAEVLANTVGTDMPAEGPLVMMLYDKNGNYVGGDHHPPPAAETNSAK